MSTEGEKIDAIDIATVLVTEILNDSELVAITDLRVDDGISLTDRLRCFLREPFPQERMARWEAQPDVRFSWERPKG